MKEEREGWGEGLGLHVEAQETYGQVHLRQYIHMQPTLLQAYKEFGTNFTRIIFCISFCT